VAKKITRNQKLIYPIEIKIFSGRVDGLFDRLEDIDMLNLLLRSTKAFAQLTNDRSDRTQLDAYWDTFQNWLRCMFQSDIALPPLYPKKRVETINRVATRP